MFRYQFPFRFYLGLVLIVASLIIGALTKITLLLYFHNSTIRWASVIVYLLSWPLLAVGGWWVGSEYYRLIRRYASYRFYQESIKEGTRKAYQRTKQKLAERRKK